MASEAHVNRGPRDPAGVREWWMHRRKYDSNLEKLRSHSREALRESTGVSIPVLRSA
jgi:hypothetical protein